jgi:hypothetical protein
VSDIAFRRTFRELENRVIWSFGQLIEQLTTIRSDMARLEHRFKGELSHVQPIYARSARNLLTPYCAIAMCGAFSRSWQLSVCRRPAAMCQRPEQGPCLTAASSSVSRRPASEFVRNEYTSVNGQPWGLWGLL